MSKSVFQFGQCFSWVAFLAATGYAVVQLLQVLKLVAWPWDEITIYGFSLAIAAPFMLAMLALHRATPEEQKLWSMAALLFSVLYAVYASLMYVVQLGTALPLAIAGRPDPIFAVNRYTLFWAIDALAYVSMGLSTLFAVPVFERGSWIRGFFLANGLFTPVIAFIYFYPHFSIPLLMLGLPWILFAPGAILLLALWFRRRQSLAAAGPVSQAN
jgi:hypothetical protein